MCGIIVGTHGISIRYTSFIGTHGISIRYTSFIGTHGISIRYTSFMNGKNRIEIPWVPTMVWNIN